MSRKAVESLAWPTIVAIHTAPIVWALVYWPSLVPQVATATTIAVMIGLVAVERLLPYRMDWSIRGDPEVWRDIAHTAAYAVAINASRALFLVLLAGVMAQVGLHGVLGLWPKTAPVWLQVCLAVVLGDGLEYAYHRLCHKNATMWRLHALHHTPTRIHVLKGGRHHFLYAFGRGFVVWTPLLLLGSPGEVVFWQYIAEVITGLVGHANVRFDLPSWVHRVVTTPQVHRIHHELDPGPGNTNFAVVLPFWDMLFSTYSHPDVVAVSAAGIADDPIPRRFFEELKSPFTYAQLERSRDAA
ncbi:MAG: sterol desaturase family protein [Ideonella sp.]|nr:sterol desaturase family protein [Ideonella sp.]